MLSKISALFHQAAEFSSQILATDATTQDEFKDHWKTVTDAITDNGSVVTLKDRLESMLQLLCMEEERVNPTDPGTVGPCLEFILRHKILDTLFTTARNDYPVGMAQQVLIFFTDILSQLERPLLHHVSIHQPILLQVNCCGEDPSGPLSYDQVQFITTICRRLNKDPRLADFFMKDVGRIKEFVVSKALIRLANSSNNLVVLKSYECLLTCATLQHSSVTAALINGPLPMMLASKLQYHFQLIPSTTRFTTILSCQSDWVLNSPQHCSSTSDFGHVIALFSWLDYCEQMISVSQPSLGKALCESIQEVFLTASLLPKLLRSKEEEILISTSVLARATQIISCRILLEELVLFTLKSSCNLISDESTELAGVSLIDKLVNRIDHINEDVCQVTLKFFDILLSSSFHAMVIEHLVNCQYIAQHYILQAEVMHSVRVQLEEDTISYLSLIPECISSSQGADGEDMKQYMREAHDKVSRIYQRCNEYVVTCISETSTNTSFLLTLLNKLETLLDQPYETNLLVTSILTQLAAAPYPTANWLFLTCTKERNVYTVLKKVADTFKLRVEGTPALFVHVIEARRRLAGQPTSDLLSMPHNNLLEGAIVLEEFIKELCSIVYAKTSWSVLALPS